MPCPYIVPERRRRTGNRRRPRHVQLSAMSIYLAYDGQRTKRDHGPDPRTWVLTGAQPPTNIP